ncbi:Asp23/Gls24 family envelope stress response protein [Pseudonocardia saturnea]
MSDSPPVRLHVGAAVVARVAAHRARRVPGVAALQADLAQALLGLAGSAISHRLGHPDHGTLPADGVHAAVQDGTAEVSITLATRLGHNCRDLAQAVQREVAAEVHAYTGLDVVVRVTVAEVLLD